MPSSLSAIDTATIHAELRRRRDLAVRLAVMRDRLRAKVVVLDARIRSEGITTNGELLRRPHARRQRRGELVEALAAALKGKTMSVREAAEAVLQAGYETNAEHFVTMVGMNLSQSGRFRRVARGRYTAR